MGILQDGEQYRVMKGAPTPEQVEGEGLVWQPIYSTRKINPN